MWRPWIGGIALLSACATGTVERQRLADGSWQLTCVLPMEACVREVEKTCREKTYRILGGTSESRRKDAPPFEKEYYTSHIGFVCAHRGDIAATLSAIDAGERSDRACGPGDTRACVGTGACAGGQTCRPDGTGFGPCDCGSLGSSGVEAGSTPPMAMRGAQPSGPTVDAGAADGGRSSP